MFNTYKMTDYFNKVQNNVPEIQIYEDSSMEAYPEIIPPTMFFIQTGYFKYN